MDERDLIHDWNQLEPTFYWATARVELDHKTLRDGPQNPSVVDPSIEDKIRLLHMMDQLGLDTGTMESRSNAASGTVLRVLVVEDEPDSSALIADELIRKGCRVETVGSGPRDSLDSYHPSLRLSAKVPEGVE
jgi:hypothetical protein